MYQKIIENGWKVKDQITGYNGIVVGVCEYLTGCTQALIIPQQLDKDGKRQEGEWFDVQRLDRVGETQITFDNEKTPGSDREAPKR